MSQENIILNTLLGSYPNTLALKEGLIPSDWIDFNFTDAPVPNRFFKRVVRDLEFDVAELALVTALQAKAYNKPLMMLPAVVGAGRYQHHCLVHNRERGALGVAQLKGKRIGIRAHAQTTVTWVRGILSNEYGVNLRDIQWVTFEHGHLAEFPDPKGFKRARADQNMVDMLLHGELDAAIIGTDLPDDDRLQPVLPDPNEAAQAWGLRHGMVPINHMMVIKNSFCNEQPALVHEVYRLLEESKKSADAKHHSSIDLTPFGIDQNKKALELLILYAYQQGLIPELYQVDDLFWNPSHFR